MREYLFNLAITNISPDGLPQTDANSDSLRTIMAIVFGIVGGLALLMIAISGLRYVISAGDPQKTAKAKEGIIFALVGLIIALSAESIVVFVVGRL